MDKKFVAFQICLVFFGIILFLVLAEFKKRMIEKKAETGQETVLSEGECAYHSLLGKPLTTELVHETGAYPVVLPESGQTPDVPLSKVGDLDTIVIYIDQEMKIVRIRCL